MTLFTRACSLTFGRIEIRGHPDFLARTQSALSLLENSRRFNIIDANIAVIRPGRRSGMKAWAKQPTFVVGRPTWQRSALWYAGAIAHDAYHAKLYGDAKRQTGSEPDPDVWTGAGAEKQCLHFQCEVMAELNADPETLAYLEECAKNPSYQGRNKGWRAWLDYRKRWW